MKIGDFNKMQRHNYLLATIGAIACVIGLTNASYNKGVVKGANHGADYVLRKAKSIDDGTFEKLKNEMIKDGCKFYE